jgi:acylphosphatase
MQTVHVRIEGRVQGVCFRDYTQRRAVALGLSGWVKNMQDGAVETLLHGDDEAIAAMITWLHRGSPHAQVSNLIVNDLHATHDLAGFEILF